MPKIKIFLWQLCHDALPSMAKLLRKGIQIDQVCLTEIKNINHLFVGCPMVKKTWDLAVSHNWLPSFPFPQIPTSIQEGLHDLYTTWSISFTRVVILLWSIWKSCNAIIFNHGVPKPMGSLVRAERKLGWMKITYNWFPSSFLTSSIYSTISQAHPTHWVEISTKDIHQTRFWWYPFFF